VYILIIVLSMGETASPIPTVDPSHSPEPEIETVIVPVYCLAIFTPSEEAILHARIAAESPALPWVKPQFVPWASDTDGTEADMLRIHKQPRKDAENVWSSACFFVDRQTLHDGSFVVTSPDGYALAFSEQAAADAQQLVRDLQWDSIDYDIDEGYRDAAFDEFIRRALTYGRIPASKFSSVWANLDIANMDVGELVEMHGGSLKLIPDPGWDATLFLKKVEQAKKARDRDEL